MVRVSLSLTRTPVGTHRLLVLTVVAVELDFPVCLTDNASWNCMLSSSFSDFRELF